MKVAIVGSRSLDIEIPEGIIPENTTEIISGAAKGIDKAARSYALNHRILITEILPEYDLYGKQAPLRRNDYIIELCDAVYAFWDGKSKGTYYVINQSRRHGKSVYVYVWDGESFKLCPEA